MGQGGTGGHRAVRPGSRDVLFRHWCPHVSSPLGLVGLQLELLDLRPKLLEFHMSDLATCSSVHVMDTGQMKRW
jgi:hypothetical protein